MEFSQSERIDLHIHSSASDGTLSPSEILARAQELKLKAIAITDHDTIAGSREALRSGIPPSIGFLTGVEISASPPPGFTVYGSFHILGYAIQLDHPFLNDTLKRQQEARKNRNPEILKRLENLGFHMTLEEIHAGFPDGQIGRPHIAQLMIRKGFVKTIDEAFDEYIGKDKPAYVEKFRLDSATAIETIRWAGGIPVLAHPSILKMENPAMLEALILSLKGMGLGGLEVYYPEHTREETDAFIAMAKRHELIMTGGTDYHGAINPEIEMGYGKGSFQAPYELYETIVKKSHPSIHSIAPVSG